MTFLRNVGAGGFLVALCVVIAALLFLGLQSVDSDIVTTKDRKVLIGEYQPLHGMDATSGGRLRFVDGCLGVEGEVIVWPHGTRVVDDHPLAAKVPDHGTIRLGDEVELGGGYVLEHSEPRPPGTFEVAGVTVPARCAQHAVFLAN